MKKRIISQVLRAGGMPMTPAKENPTSNDWYYYSSGWGRGRTSSWTSAHEFRKYWADVNGVGAKKAYAFVRYTPSDFENNNTWEEIYEFLEPGDVVQYVRLSTGGKTYHSQAVYDTYYSGGKYCVKVGQHTNNEFKNLEYLASFYPNIKRKNIEEIMISVGLNPTEKKHVGKYSLGMKQRLGIAQSLLGNPKLLVLDEPFNGLDHDGVIAMRDLLKQKNNSGVTILLASHYEEDISILCHKTYQMEAGKIYEK